VTFRSEIASRSDDQVPAAVPERRRMRLATVVVGSLAAGFGAALASRSCRLARSM